MLQSNLKFDELNTSNEIDSVNKYFEEITDCFKNKSEKLIIYSKDSKGKSKLVYNYARKYMPDSTIWVNCESEELIKHYFRNTLAKELEIELIPNDYTQLLSNIKGRLESLYIQGKRHLFIFDNIQDYELIKKYILIFNAYNVYFLITTNDQKCEIIKKPANVGFINLDENLYYSKDSIENKLGRILEVNNSNEEYLLLKWLLAYQQEFIPHRCIKEIINMSKNKEFKEDISQSPAFFEDESLLEKAILGLKNELIIDEMRINNEIYLKINSAQEIRSYLFDFKIDYLALIESIQLKLVDLLITGFKFCNKDENSFESILLRKTYIHVSIMILSYFEREDINRKFAENDDFKSKISILYICMATTFYSVFHDSQIELYYLKKSSKILRELQRKNIYTERVLCLLFTLGKVYSRSLSNNENLKLAETYFNEILQLQKAHLSTNFNNEQSLIYLHLGQIQTYTNNIQKAKASFANALLYVEEEKSLYYVFTLKCISQLFLSTRQFDNSLKILDNAIEILKELKEEKRYCGTLFVQKAECLFNLERYEECKEYLEKAEEFLKKEYANYSCSEMLLVFKLYIGLYRLILNNETKAKEYFMKLEDYIKNLNYVNVNENIASIYNNFASLRLDNFGEQSFKFLNHSNAFMNTITEMGSGLKEIDAYVNYNTVEPLRLPYIERTQDNQIKLKEDKEDFHLRIYQIEFLMNQATVSGKLFKAYSSEINGYMKALNYANENGLNYYRLHLLERIALFFKREKKFQFFLDYILQAYNISLEIPYESHLKSEICIHVGDAYLMLKEPQDAIRYLQESIKIHGELVKKNRNIMKEDPFFNICVFERLVIAYKQLNDDSKAKEYNDKVEKASEEYEKQKKV